MFLFILTVPQCTNPENYIQKTPICLMFTQGAHTVCVLVLGQKEYSIETLRMLRGSFPVSVAKTTVLAATCLCGLRAESQKAGQKDRGMQAKRIWESSAQAVACWSTKPVL